MFALANMPGVEGPAKQLHLHARTHVAPGDEQLVSCAQHLHRVEIWITFSLPLW